MHAPRLGPRHARGPEPGDGRRLDLRPRPGGAEPDALRAASTFRTRSDERCMNAPAYIAAAAATIEFTLDGRDGAGARGRDHPAGRASATASTIPRLCYKEGYRPDGNCRACVVEVDGRAHAGAELLPRVHAGMEVQAASERAQKSQKMVLEMLLADMPERATSGSTTTPRGQHGELSDWAARLGVTVRPELQRAAPRAARARPLAPRDGGQPRRLHPVHALRARLPRGAGQRRDRLRLARRAQRRSCSTSATRWATAPAWPAANACRPARPAR